MTLNQPQKLEELRKLGKLGRPTRAHEVDEVCRLADCKPASLRNFFSRPGRLSPQLRQRIAEAVVQVGYEPQHPGKGPLKGARLGYEIPRIHQINGSTPPNAVMDLQFQDLLLEIQKQGAILIPFIVDGFVAGVEDVSGGTTAERIDPLLSHQGWRREYAKSLAPAMFEQMMRRAHVQGFFVNDLQVDDSRLNALHESGVPYVAMGKPMRMVKDKVVDDDRHPSVETDNTVGIARMVELLREAGARTFAHLGFMPDESVVPYARSAAVRAAAGPNVPLCGIHYEQVANRDASVRSVARWLKHQALGVDAVICDSDSLADILRSAAPEAGRRVVRNLEAASADVGHVSLLACGNDDAPSRRGDWMTMHADRFTVAKAAVDLMASRLPPGSTAPTTVMVPPVIVGAPRGGPSDEMPIDP